jgi:hypothetical protein
MTDTTLPQKPERLRMDHFDDISNGAKMKVQQRGLRRAISINAVVMAREHAGRAKEPFSQQEADVIMAITELLDKVSEAS